MLGHLIPERFENDSQQPVNKLARHQFKNLQSRLAWSLMTGFSTIVWAGKNHYHLHVHCNITAGINKHQAMETTQHQFILTGLDAIYYARLEDHSTSHLES